MELWQLAVQEVDRLKQSISDGKMLESQRLQLQVQFCLLLRPHLLLNRWRLIIVSPLDGAIATEIRIIHLFSGIITYVSCLVIYVCIRAFNFIFICLILGSACSGPTECKAASRGQSDTKTGKRTWINLTHYHNMCDSLSHISQHVWLSVTHIVIIFNYVQQHICFL